MRQIASIILILFYNYEIIVNYDDQDYTRTEELTTRHYNDSFIIYGTKLFNDLNKSEIIDRIDETVKNKSISKSAVEPQRPGTESNLTSFGKIINRVPILKKVFGTECYQNIGCFHAITFDDVGHGQLAMLPMSPDKIDPAFFVYTSKSPENPIEFRYNFDSKELKKSDFNPKHRTVLIVHGFRTGIEDWMIETKNYLFAERNNSFNVVLVEWTKGSMLDNYALSSANTQVVGALIALFITKTCGTYNGISNKDFHLIGHSLGAEIMGFAGNRLDNPKVSRITGLDPAGPGFRAKGRDYRLDYTDATLVDIIHSDMASDLSKGLGINEVVGDIDFYPNGGIFQPGCPKSTILLNILKSLINKNLPMSCSHNKAPVFSYSFGELDGICLPVGYICEDWLTFLEGRCANCDTVNKLSQCQLMGIYPEYWENILISKENGEKNKYFVNTGSHKDYCRNESQLLIDNSKTDLNLFKTITEFHYQIAFHITKDSDSKSRGLFEISVTAQINQTEKVLNFARVMSQIEPGHIHTLLVTFDISFSNVSKISFQWKRLKQLIGNTGQKLGIEFIEMNYMSHINEKIRKGLSLVLCPANSSYVLKNENKVDFVKCVNNKKPKKSVLKLNPNDIKAFTKREDLVSVDFNNTEIIRNKIYIKTNLFPIKFFRGNIDDKEKDDSND